jgi:hypothetical protein
MKIDDWKTGIRAVCVIAEQPLFQLAIWATKKNAGLLM